MSELILKKNVVSSHGVFSNVHHCLKTRGRQVHPLICLINVSSTHLPLNKRSRTCFLRTQLFKDPSQVGHTCKCQNSKHHQKLMTQLVDKGLLVLAHRLEPLFAKQLLRPDHQLHPVLKSALPPPPTNTSSWPVPSQTPGPQSD